MGSDAEVTFPVCDPTKAIDVGSRSEELPDFENGAFGNITRTPITHVVALPPYIIECLENMDNCLVAAFDRDGNCYGAAGLTDEMVSLTIFGDDPFRAEKDGFLEGEQIFYRVYFPDSEKEFEFEAVYDENLPQHDVYALKASTEIIPAVLMDDWIRIYPNPAGRILFVQSKEIENTKFVIINAQGQFISQGEITKNNIEINISCLTPGFFIIKFVSDNKSCVKQFIKQ